MHLGLREVNMLSDGIRQFVYEHYILLARQRGERTIKVRAGDIHQQMQLVNQMPAVCGAIGTQKFEQKYNVRLISREGPSNGANVYFTFQI